MSWTKWPYWLRGGVIGGGITLVSAMLTNLCEYLVVVPGYSGLGFECFPFAIPWIPFWFFPHLTSSPGISYEIIVFGAWFLLGSLVGAFVGRLKSKKYSYAGQVKK